jgi:hypothetical protein
LDSVAVSLYQKKDRSSHDENKEKASKLPSLVPESLPVASVTPSLLLWRICGINEQSGM